MKFFILTLALSSFSAMANSHIGMSAKTLENALKVSTCSMKVMKSPVIFGKDQPRALSKQLVFIASEEVHSIRRLKVGRVLNIHSTTKRLINLDDSSVNSVCVLDLASKKCSKDISKLTLGQLQDLSGQNLKITCKRDQITDM